jgi:hypothetical protein
MAVIGQPLMAAARQILLSAHKVADRYPLERADRLVYTSGTLGNAAGRTCTTRTPQRNHLADRDVGSVERSACSVRAVARSTRD